MRVIVNIPDEMLLVAAGLAKEDKAVVSKAVEICMKEVLEPAYCLTGGHALMIADRAVKEVINRLERSEHDS